MSRYIDADAMDKRRIDYIVDGYAESVNDMTEWGMALIEAPTIDIVRCGECKYVDSKKCPMYFMGLGYTDDDFCSYGERREGKE